MIGYTNKAAVLYGGCQPNTYFKLTFHYSSLYASFFTNSDYVIFLRELVFCFFEDWLPTWPLYMADMNSCKNTL